MSSYHEVERLKASGRYNEAFEIVFGEQTRHYHDFGGLYRTFKEYREKCPSLNVSDSKRKEMYKGLCDGDWPAIRSLSAQDRDEIINDMEKLGLIDEAIHALKKSCDKGFDIALDPQNEHFKVAELYEKKGNFENAAQIYEDYCLLDHAVRCYERLGRIERLALYFLAEGKVQEAITLYEKAGRRDKVNWVKTATNFNLSTYEHPLRKAKHFNSNKGDLLYRVQESDEYGRREAKYKANIVLNDGELKGHQFKEILPTELVVLLRALGNGKEADQIAAMVQQLRTAMGGAKGGRLWWLEPGSRLRHCLFSGQFFKGILLGELCLDVLSRRTHDSKDREIVGVTGVVSRCYEALGSFSEATDWKIRQMDAYKYAYKKDKYGWIDAETNLYRDLSRLYLKQGNFAKAAEIYQCLLDKEKGSSQKIDLDGYLMVAELYRCGGNNGGSKKVVEDLFEKFRSIGELPKLADALNGTGFLEEAVKIYDELGGKTRSSKASDNVESTAPEFPDLDLNFDDEETITCSCGETLQPHWKLCPSCGNPVELMCSCGEPLKAGWKLCPACGKKITA
jgi:tetratricopeptide (TPR) repeat protein